MSVLLPVSSVTPLDIFAAALGHLGVIDPDEPVGASESAICMRSMKSLLDAWNLDPSAIVGRQELSITPASGTKSFTIGTGGDISTITMPLRIEYAYYRVNGFDTPIPVKPLESYLLETSKGLTGPPWLLAYERGNSLGTAYLYPASDGVSELRMQVLLDAVSGFASLTQKTPMTLPAGYRSALEWCLADEVSSDFQVAPQRVAMAAKKAAIALRRVKRANTRVPQLTVGAQSCPTDIYKRLA